MGRSKHGRAGGRAPRVIAGSAGGLRLAVPEGTSTRPTSDRVKESLFAALGPGRLEGASVLDLYAGTGALGIEALSRGAARAVLVETDGSAVRAIQANLTSTRLGERARVQRGDVEAFLGAPPPPEAPFDLVLLDPPYELSAERLAGVLDALTTPGIIRPGGWAVLEGPTRRALVSPSGLRLARERHYGDTVVRLFTTSEEGQ